MTKREWKRESKGGGEEVTMQQNMKRKNNAQRGAEEGG
jgi:hypothetical protein